jgi:hypothetical protein
MNLPFTETEFFEVFTRYNAAVWPFQLVLFAAAVASFAAAMRRVSWAPRVMYALLAFLWLWMAVVYHALYFRSINPAASVFAAIFLLQAALLAWTVRTPGSIQPDRSLQGILGLALVVYALLLYPIVGAAVGHAYPANPTFGLPCPTTLFTMGILLWARPTRPALLFMPILWSIVGLTAALRLGVLEDSALAVSAIAGVALIVADLQRRRRASVASARESAA